jgi:putative transposase
MALERMVAGLSTRNYSAGLEPVGDVDQTGTKRSSVSRRFVERTTSALKELMARDLSQLDIVALLLDGVEIAEHTMVVALGIDAKGRKHPLGLREGTTENKGVCRALLSNLVERGLDFSNSILVVIDGGKGLGAAVNSVFGRLALVQRCQLHKRRNVIDHLPEHMHSFVTKKMERAYKMRDFGAAKRLLQELAKTLDGHHPGAAASLREGLGETLTVVRLELSPSLQRTLRSTNTIESMISIGAHDDAKRQALARRKDDRALDRGLDARGREALLPGPGVPRHPGTAGRASNLSQGGDWIGEGSCVVFSQWRAVSKSTTARTSSWPVLHGQGLRNVTGKVGSRG